MPPGLQAQCVESSSHPVIEFWRFQDRSASTSPLSSSLHYHQHPSCQLPPNCRPQNHYPSCKPPCLQTRCVQSLSHPVIESWRFQDCKFLTSNHRVIHSSWGFQDCKVSIGPRLPCNPVPQAATGRETLSPQNTPKSMKSTQIHLESPAGCRITVQAASFHACLLQGAESPSKLPGVPRLQGFYRATTPV